MHFDWTQPPTAASNRKINVRTRNSYIVLNLPWVERRRVDCNPWLTKMEFHKLVPIYTGFTYEKKRKKLTDFIIYVAYINCIS